MSDEELFEKIMNKELTICNTCDNIFAYVPQKVFCDECKREKIRKYSEKNREKKAVYDRKWRGENREKINAYMRKYREDNREKINARERKYYEENREKERARARARYHANKEK